MGKKICELCKNEGKNCCFKPYTRVEVTTLDVFGDKIPKYERVEDCVDFEHKIEPSLRLWYDFCCIL